ncbi:unnamed protein product [Triticum turgidum subsp. durum]|uniref:Major facilitator superfamily (MFS) profile domain-containing protein n=1 Tax=Triticum turgidum subsp. durum TaxID=4567 RepID=A0A9R0YYX7_TRITD|nr:unnamed protein product [Triticum turgidum subsp. durum]
MRGAALVALAAALGNMLQGWDNATIAGSLLYIKRDFGLHGQPALQGLVVATSLIGATLITTFSGPLSDRVGRRPMLVASSLLYALAGLLMLWSPTVGVLLLARLVDGFAVGLAVTLVPVYISETAPPEVRGLLSTLPQLTGSTGMFLAYCMVFAMTLAPSPNWRVMMGVLVLPSLVYVAVAVLFLPESPRWLILQQFSGISGILYYTPQILDQAGVSVLLSNLGLTSDSAAILISGLTTLLMLPAIAVAMRLMDVAGRRSLLLWTIPVLIVSLVSLVTADVLPLATTLHAAVSTTSIIVYICTFVMGFGPIPGILCSEIFPTRVRGMCIAICSLAFWLSNIAVTYSMPVMLDYLGLTGVFSIYAAVCCVALAFVALRVPETKGLPLEVIAEFFNVASKGMPKLDHDE